jgi:hypothetical protein
MEAVKPKKRREEENSEYLQKMAYISIPKNEWI